MGKNNKKKKSPNNNNKSNYKLRSSSSQSGTSGTDTEDEQPIANNNNNMPSSASTTHATSVTNPSTPPPANNSPPSELDRPPEKGGLEHVAAAKLLYKEAAAKAVTNFPPGTSSPAMGLTQRIEDSSQPNEDTLPDSVDTIPTSGFDTTPNDSNMGGKKLALTTPKKGEKDWEGKPLDKGQTTICFVKEGDNNIETAKVGTITTPKGKSTDLSPIPETLEELIKNNPMGADMADTLHAHSNQINTIMENINNMDKSIDITSLKDTRENLEQVTAAATTKLEHINAGMKQLDDDVAAIKNIRSNYQTMLEESNAELAKLTANKDECVESADIVNTSLGRTRDNWIAKSKEWDDSLHARLETFHNNEKKYQERWDTSMAALETKKQESLDNMQRVMNNMVARSNEFIATMETRSTELLQSIQHVEKLQAETKSIRDTHTATIDSTVSTITEDSRKLIDTKVEELSKINNDKFTALESGLVKKMEDKFTSLSQSFNQQQESSQQQGSSQSQFQFGSSTAVQRGTDSAFATANNNDSQGITRNRLGSPLGTLPEDEAQPPMAEERRQNNNNPNLTVDTGQNRRGQDPPESPRPSGNNNNDRAGNNNRNNRARSSGDARNMVQGWDPNGGPPDFDRSESLDRFDRGIPSPRPEGIDDTTPPEPSEHLGDESNETVQGQGGSRLFPNGNPAPMNRNYGGRNGEGRNNTHSHTSPSHHLHTDRQQSRGTDRREESRDRGCSDRYENDHPDGVRTSRDTSRGGWSDENPRYQFGTGPSHRRNDDRQTFRQQRESPRSLTQTTPLANQRIRSAARRMTQEQDNWLRGYEGTVNDGVDVLDESALHSLGVFIEGMDALLDMHFKWRRDINAYGDGSGSASKYNGPQAERALKYEGWEPLSDLDVTSFVTFYKHITDTCELFGIYLTPLAAINTKYKSVGLCVAGTGYYWYKEMGSHLYRVLNSLLPKNKPSISTQCAVCESQTKNGFDLLWNVGFIVIKLWDTTHQLERPIWTDSDNMFLWLNKITTFRMLQRQRGIVITDKDESKLFLQGITAPRYQTVAQSLLWHLNGIQPEAPFAGASEEDFTIPAIWQSTQLCADIVSQAGENAAVGDMTFSSDRQQNRRRVNLAIGQDNSRMLDIPEDMICHEITPGLHLHGHEALCNALRQNGKRFQRRSPTENRPEPNPASTFRRRTRRPTFNGACPACGRFGHEPPHCDFLAMFVWTKKYLRNVSRSILEENEKQWMERNKRFLGEKKDNTPRKVARTYAESLGCGVDHLAELADAELDWDYFEPQPDDDPIVVDEE